MEIVGGRIWLMFSKSNYHMTINLKILVPSFGISVQNIIRSASAIKQKYLLLLFCLIPWVIMHGKLCCLTHCCAIEVTMNAEKLWCL